MCTDTVTVGSTALPNYSFINLFNNASESKEALSKQGNMGWVSGRAGRPLSYHHQRAGPRSGRPLPHPATLVSLQSPTQATPSNASSNTVLRTLAS